MKKIDQLKNPNSCINRAMDDEPTFVLLGRDVAASNTIRHWVRQRIWQQKNSSNDPQILEALETAKEMEEYARQRLR